MVYRNIEKRRAKAREYYHRDKKFKNCRCGKQINTTSNLCKGCSHRGKSINSNEKNPMWKGDKAKLNAIHQWVKRRKIKPQFCEECKINLISDLANISQQYERNIDDYEWLCRSCHMTKDGRIYNLKQNKPNFESQSPI